MTDAGPHPDRGRHPRPFASVSERVRSLMRGRLWLQVLVGMVLGIGAGIMLGPSVAWIDPETATTVANWLAFPGKIFLALIQMIVIPLVFSSIIRGLASSGTVGQLRRVGLRVVVLFLLTTTFAIAIGLILADVIEPGRFVEGDAVHSLRAAASQGAETGTPPRFVDLPQALLGLLPANPLVAAVESNMLQVVIFSVVVGAALVMMAPRQAKPLLDLLGSLQEVCMTVVRWAMRIAPYAVFGLLAQLTTRIGFDAIIGMAVYVGTVMTGLLILLLVSLTVLYGGTGITPGRYLGKTRELLLLAFSTSSSAAVMPLSIRTAEKKLNVRPSISQFVIPLGATINMDGTALYQGIAALFLSQVYGIDIGLGGMALIVVTAVGASIGTPATPGVGIVILATVLGSVGIPPAGIALIIGVDRILDMSRTVINVSGDLVATSLLDRWAGREQSADAANQEKISPREPP
ncbi:MAG: dicarboxylate/amino acid:cation symporter [Rhodospirillales bacterium]|nr:dicarboxylate/amino acid:cation symporter [Rhodospirillales bacterium]